MAFQPSSNDSNAPIYITDMNGVNSHQFQQAFKYLLSPSDCLSNSPTYLLWNTPINSSVTRNFSYSNINGNGEAFSQTSAAQDQDLHAPTLYMESIEKELELERVYIPL